MPGAITYRTAGDHHKIPYGLPGPLPGSSGTSPVLTSGA